LNFDAEFICEVAKLKWVLSVIFLLLNCQSIPSFVTFEEGQKIVIEAVRKFAVSLVALVKLKGKRTPATYN
jgi:hypothetical protein